MSLPHSSLWEPLSQLVHSVPTSSQTLPSVPALANLCPWPPIPSSQKPCCQNLHLPFSGCQVRLRGGLIVQSLLSAPVPPPLPPPGPQPGTEDADGHSLWGVLGREGTADLLTLAPQEGLSFRVLRPQEGIQKLWMFVTRPPQQRSMTPSTAAPLSTPSLNPATGPTCPQTHRSTGQSGPEP